MKTWLTSAATVAAPLRLRREAVEPCALWRALSAPVALIPTMLTTAIGANVLNGIILSSEHDYVLLLAVWKVGKQGL